MTRKEPLLLTPGPLTTSLTTKQAMLQDWGSRDHTFIAMNARVRERLLAMAGGEGTHTTVLLQGSGTFAVEAMIGTLVPRAGKLLILINGAYGKRMVAMCQRIGRAHVAIEVPEDTPVDPAAVEAMLAKDAAITHVTIVHCETTSGILNPTEKVAAIVAKAGRKLLVDAMSAFGALPFDLRQIPCEAVAASSNKCIEGAPGIGFVIIEKAALAAAAGNAHSLSLDLHDQWQNMEKTKQWRFTPPTHVLAAFDQAISEHAAEGGVAGRGERYRRNCRILVEGMRARGFSTLLPDHLQAPIIITFHMPKNPRFVFQTFYDRLREQGYVIYPGKLTVADSFRIGCIGQLHEADMRGALAAIDKVLAEMGVQTLAPAA